MISIFRDKSGEANIDRNQFTEAAQQIELNRIQADFVAQIIKHQVQRNREKYRYEAEIFRAKLHYSASRFGYNALNEDGSSVVCPCCSLKIHSEPFPLCYPTTDTSPLEEDPPGEFKLDSGVALFFEFVKIIIFYFVLRFLLVDAFNLFTNYMYGQYCHALNETQCARVLWNYFSVFNKRNRQDLLHVQDILNLISVVVSIVFFVCIRKRLYKFYDLIDQNIQTQDDYTLMVSNIPTLDFPKQSEESAKNVEFYYRKHLEAYFNDKIQYWLNDNKNWRSPKQGTIEYDLEALRHENGGELRSPEIVKSISLCYNLSRLETIESTREELMDRFVEEEGKSKKPKKDRSSQQSYYMNEEQVKHQQDEKSRFSTIPKKIDFLNDCEIVLNKQFANDNSVLFNMTHFVGHAFVSFQYQHFRDYILMQASTDDKFLEYNGSYLEVSPAAHPSEIYWEHLRIGKNKRLRRTILSFLILIMVLVFAFSLVSFAQIMKEQHAPPDLTFPIDAGRIANAYWPTILATVFILLVNFALSLMIHQLTKFEKHETRTDESVSLVTKLVIYQFINTAIIYYVISIIKPMYTDKDAFTSSMGLIVQISWLILFSALIQIFLNLVYPPDLGRRIKNWFKYGRMRNEEVVNTFQVRLNRETELPEFDMSDWYSYFLLQTLLLSFYSYLIPAISPITIVCFFIQYWLVKFILFRRSSLYYTFSFNLTKVIGKIFESSILVYAAGTAIFSHAMGNNWLYLNDISLLIAFVYIFLRIFMPEKYERMILGQYERCEKPMYQDCVADGKFEQTYWKQNPATSLVNESDVTQKRSIYNPVQKIVYANQQHFFQK